MERRISQSNLARLRLSWSIAKETTGKDVDKDIKDAAWSVYSKDLEKAFFEDVFPELKGPKKAIIVQVNEWKKGGGASLKCKVDDLRGTDLEDRLFDAAMPFDGPRFKLYSRILELKQGNLDDLLWSAVNKRVVVKMRPSPRDPLEWIEKYGVGCVTEIVARDDSPKETT